MKKMNRFIISFMLLLSVVSVHKAFYVSDSYCDPETGTALCEHVAEPYGSPYEQELES